MSKLPNDVLRAARMRKFASAEMAAKAHGWNPTTYRSHENGTRGIGAAAAQMRNLIPASKN